ncbi:MAG: hypothetical protein LBF63_04975, partial [Treponema sp.]|nr:hypothetical protein [Treponema sp.]
EQLKIREQKAINSEQLKIREQRAINSEQLGIREQGTMDNWGLRRNAAFCERLMYTAYPPF